MISKQGMCMSRLACVMTVAHTAHSQQKICSRQQEYRYNCRHKTIFIMKAAVFVFLCVIYTCTAFAPSPRQSSIGTRLYEGKGFFGKFFEELDAFVDDATNRRLGNGAAFYGKRKSAFYGEEDFMKKDDKNVSDPTEDYQGPKKAGYFQWMPDENGMMRPVTRMKKKNIERNPSFWDKNFSENE